MEITLNMIIGSVVNLALFFTVLVLAAKKPMANALQNRSDAIANTLKTAEGQIADITAKIAAQDKQIADLQSTVAAIKANGEATSKKLAEDVVAGARAEGEAMRKRLEREVEAELQLTAQKLRRELGVQAIQQAEALLASRLDGNRQNELVRDFATQLTGTGFQGNGGNN
jgi:F0F1-type ATP synthase membrane subunit b/b'